MAIKLQKNTIPQQTKNVKDSISWVEWNSYINQLRVQANHLTSSQMFMMDILGMFKWKRLTTSTIGEEDIVFQKDLFATQEAFEIYVKNNFNPNYYSAVTAHVLGTSWYMRSEPEELIETGTIISILNYLMQNSGKLQENIKAGKEIKMDFHDDGSITINVDRNDRFYTGDTQPIDPTIQFWLDTNEYVEPTSEVMETPEIEPIILQEEVVETPISKLNE